MNDTFSVGLEQIFPVIKEKLASGGSVSFSPKGTSMLPLIKQGEDSVTISPVSGKLKKYDVPLYLRKNGQFVLHRIIDVRKDGYVMCGDNQCNFEYGIDDTCIIGIMTQIIKPDKIICVTDKQYLSYCKKRVLKIFIKRIYRKFKRMVKRILKYKHK